MKKRDELLWFQKYRPITLESYIGNDELKSYLESAFQKNDIQNLIFYGKPGTGKTTAAKIIIDNLNCDNLYLNASDDNGIDTVRDKISTFAMTASFKPLKIVVLDDCHNLTPAAQQALLNLIETVSRSTRFIFTTNSIGKIIPALQSRCQSFIVTPPGKQEIAEFMDNILTQEGIEYDVDNLVKLINKHFPDIRKMINVAQASSADGVFELNDSIGTVDYIDKIISILKNKSKDKWPSIRQIVTDNALNDFTEVYYELYEKVSEFASNSVGEVVLAIAEAEYQSAFVPDREITFMASIYKIIQLIK